MTSLRVLAMAASALALAACGAADEGSDDARGGGGADAAAAPAAPAAPGIEGRQAIVADFQAANPNHCPFYKTDGGSTDDGDFAGSTLTLCSGRFSQSENFGLAMMNEDGVNFPAGTFFVTVGPNRAPGAFGPLYDVMYDVAGIDGMAEQEQLRSEVQRWIYATPNTYTVDWEPVMTTDSGVRIRAATHQFGQQGTLTLRFDPPV